MEAIRMGKKLDRRDVSLSLPNKVVDALDKIAEERAMSRSVIAQETLERGLKTGGDLHD